MDASETLKKLGREKYQIVEENTDEAKAEEDKTEENLQMKEN